MSHPIDVGSVLGGRYKVTATVLTSHDQDLVLDGVDQVLNRAVSILVAGPDNAEQVAKSAREVATGERPGHVQILDLGVSDLTTYLITNHTSAADLLDLVVSANPPYVEPFFTDTLGSEIFGQARSKEPETYDGLYDDEEVDAGYIDYGQQPRAAAEPMSPPVQPSRGPSRPTSPPSPPAGAAAAAAAGMAAASGSKKSPKAAPPAKQHITAPQPVQNAGVPQPTTVQPGVPSAPAQPGPDSSGSKPKVSLWSDDDYNQDGPAEQAAASSKAQPAAAKAAGASAVPAQEDRTPRNFPAAARTSEADEDDYSGDDEPDREPRSKRWLVGGLLAAVLVVGLIFAVNNLGSLFKSGPQPAAGPSSAGTPAASPGKPSPDASSAPAAGPPAIDGVSRSGDFDFAGTYDADLAKTFDGNSASYWSDMEFATDNWGGLTTEVPLVVKLKSPSQISSVTLSQLGASGGNISVLTNDRPSLDGAKQVGSNSFTSPDLTISLQEPVTAEYVIVSIKTLPKLAAPKTRYGFGLRLAEIKVQ